MNDVTELRKQQVLDLTSEIARAADDGVGANARDIVVAAKAIQKIVSPSVLEDSARLVIRMAPHVPKADRVELMDGTPLAGVRAIEIADHMTEPRVAKITVVGPAVLGQPEVNASP